MTCAFTILPHLENRSSSWRSVIERARPETCRLLPVLEFWPSSVLLDLSEAVAVISNECTYRPRLPPSPPPLRAAGERLRSRRGAGERSRRSPPSSRRGEASRGSRKPSLAGAEFCQTGRVRHLSANVGSWCERSTESMRGRETRLRGRKGEEGRYKLKAEGWSLLLLKATGIGAASELRRRTGRRRATPQAQK